MLVKNDMQVIRGGCSARAMRWGGICAYGEGKDGWRKVNWEKEKGNGMLDSAFQNRDTDRKRVFAVRTFLKIWTVTTLFIIFTDLIITFDVRCGAIMWRLF